jgi:hypothetical protein
MYKKIIKSVRLSFTLAVITTLLTLGMPGVKTVQANAGAAFLGGMLAGHVVGGAIRRDKVKTAAAVEAASQPKTTETVYVQQPVSAPATQAKTTSTEQKLNQLDKLAADGYITKEEYQARRKAVLDAM